MLTFDIITVRYFNSVNCTLCSINVNTLWKIHTQTRELIFISVAQGFRVSCILIHENTYTKTFSNINDNTRTRQ